MWVKIITPSAATIDEPQMSKEEFLPSQEEPDVHLELRFVIVINFNSL